LGQGCAGAVLVPYKLVDVPEKQENTSEWEASIVREIRSVLFPEFVPMCRYRCSELQLSPLHVLQTVV